MKKFVCLIVVLGLGACKTTDTDPDNGVSNASYRQSIGRAEQSIAAIVSRMVAAQGKDRTDAWWVAIKADLGATRDQLHVTLQGNTK